ncbi:undecaprenyl-diphosphate phosphatase [Hydrogenophaga sp. RWCD_12]|uniref:undecaprenyl-diphosphate phosphatase n=1 Tax=Hydrogenophaga sp. RWCD_12 TaxID=3391190 RepID=UPI00398535A2
MDLIFLIKTALMGVVEGLTEFLPVSSTGHLILAGSLLGFHDERAKVFEIAIQTGAILAVIIVYWQRIRQTIVDLPSQRQAQRFALNVVIGCVPAVVLGLLFSKAIKAHLFNPTSVAMAFIVGAFVILWAEKRPQSAARVQAIDDLTPIDALKVGLAQCCGLIPGTSRSGSTIIGGMLFGLSRPVATEFSFFLGIPILIGAGAYDTYKARALLSAADAPMFAVGLLFSFLSAWVCIRWLLRYVASHSFTPFAWYRIAFGALILLSAHFGWVNWAG